MAKRVSRNNHEVSEPDRDVWKDLEKRFNKAKRSGDPQTLKKLLADCSFVAEQTETEASRTKNPEMYEFAAWAYGCAGACAKYLGDYKRYKGLTKESNNVRNKAAVDADFNKTYTRRYFLNNRYTPEEMKEDRRFMAKNRLENYIKTRGRGPHLGIILILLVLGLSLFAYPSLTGNVINSSQIDAYSISGAILFACSLLLLGIYIYNRKN
jgi:hypothetical protein